LNKLDYDFGISQALPAVTNVSVAVK